jgi:hypothetical protein
MARRTDGRRVQDLPVTERPWALAMAIALGAAVIGVSVFANFAGDGQRRRVAMARGFIAENQDVLPTLSDDGPQSNLYIGPYTGGASRDHPLGALQIRGDAESIEALTRFIASVEALGPPLPIWISAWIYTELDSELLDSTHLESWADGDPATVDDWLERMEATKP